MKVNNQPAIAETVLGPIEYLPQTHETKPDISRHAPETIVAIHGAMGGYEQSDILGRAVGPVNYNYIAISRPGYLQTPLKGKESPEAQADLIAALLDALGLHRVILLAVSGGGYSALTFAHRHPERCRALLLCSTTGGKNTVPVSPAFYVMRFAARVPKFAQFMKKRFDKNVEQSLRRSVSHQDIVEQMLKNERIMSLYRELTHSTLNRMAKRIPGTINDIRITQKTEYPLEQITAPALVVHGSEDPIVPFEEHGKKLAERLPNSTLCLAERGGHMTIFTHNGQVRRAIEDFLKTNDL